MGRRLEKNYLFCEPCFLSLFRPLFVRYIYRKYPTYISDKLCSKSDQKTRAKQVGYFRLIYRTNCGLNKWKKHASQNSFFPNGEWRAVWKKTILSNLFCARFLVRLRAQFVRYISRIFPIYISDK